MKETEPDSQQERYNPSGRYNPLNFLSYLGYNASTSRTYEREPTRESVCEQVEWQRKRALQNYCHDDPGKNVPTTRQVRRARTNSNDSSLLTRIMHLFI